MLSGPRKTKFVAQDTSKPCISLTIGTRNYCIHLVFRVGVQIVWQINTFKKTIERCCRICEGEMEQQQEGYGSIISYTNRTHSRWCNHLSGFYITRSLGCWSSSSVWRNFCFKLFYLFIDRYQLNCFVSKIKFWFFSVECIVQSFYLFYALLIVYMFNSGVTRCVLCYLFILCLGVHVSGSICTHHEDHNCKWPCLSERCPKPVPAPMEWHQTIHNVWLFAAVVLLMMGANSTRNV
jgi:hypothetical protein